MKRVLLFVICAGLATMFAFGQKKETRTVSDFTEINASSAFEITVSKGSAEALVIEADDDVMSQVRSEVRNCVLHLYLEDEKKVKNVKTLKASVVMKNLCKVSLSGACKLTANDLFTPDRFKSDCSGASYLAVNLNTGELNIDASGANMIQMKANVTGNVKINVSGVSEVHGELNAANVNLHSSGVSTINIKGSAESLKIDVSGMSKIQTGNFKVKTAAVESSNFSVVTVNAAKTLNVNSSSKSSVKNKGAAPANRSNSKTNSNTSPANRSSSTTNSNTSTADKQEYVSTRTFDASLIKEVDANIYGGNVTVNGETGSMATVELNVVNGVHNKNWSSEKIKKLFEENYTLDIQVEKGKLSVVTKRKDRNNDWDPHELFIKFRINVPQQVNSNVMTYAGGIGIYNLTGGSQDFTTLGGMLVVENVSGNINGRTTGGNIVVKNAHDHIRLATSGGSVTANDCSGNIYLGTAGGSIKLDNLSGNIDAATSGCSMNLNNISGSIDARTSGGSMTVTMVSVSEYVKLSNNGNITLTLPSNKGYYLNVKGNKIETSGLKGFHGDKDNYRLEGTVDSGGSKIDVLTSQRVNLSFK